MKKLGNEEKTKAKGSQFSSVSHVQLFATPRTTACQVSLSITNSLSLLKLMSIQSEIPSNHGAAILTIFSLLIHKHRMPFHLGLSSHLFSSSFFQFLSATFCSFHHAKFTVLLLNLFPSISFFQILM